MDKILLVPVFLPLIAGFVLLFLPNRLRSISSVLTLIISIVTFVLGITIFTGGKSEYAWSILHLGEQLGGLELVLMLSVKPLGAFMLMFAMGFGLLITLYSLRSIGQSMARVNEYYAAILLTIGGSAGILLSTTCCFC